MLVPLGGLTGYTATAHLTTPPPWWVDEVSTGDGAEQGAKAADRAVAKTGADHKVVATGDPVKRIVSLAGELDVDLVVAGTRDASLLERIFLGGSVSRDLVDKAPCSVLIVR